MKKSLLILATVFTINANAQIITTVAGNGTCAYAGDGAAATSAELCNPQAVAFDAAGNYYIADEANNRIRKVTISTGKISTVAGTGAAGYSGDGAAATAAKLNSPWSVACDKLGNIYIADNVNYRIRKVNTTGIISTYAGNGTNAYSGDGGQATAAAIGNPLGVACDTSGNLYIADSNGFIRKVTTSGVINTVAGGGGSFGDGGQATAAQLNGPHAVALDPLGNIYICDYFNFRIRKVNTSGIIITVAGNGTSGFTGDGGQATAAKMKYSNGVACDASGNIFIADTWNDRIRKVSSSGIINTIAGNGTGAFSGDGGQSTAAAVYQPYGLALDASGNLYIADFDNIRIRKITNAGQTTGIEEFTNNNEQLNIYPNPNNGSFVIEPSSATKQTMQVYDINGKLVLSQTINGKTSIDASSLNEGVYNISLQSNEGIINKRVVIVR